MKYIGIIPARYASTRFPGKPLAPLCGKPLVQRVYERVSGLLDDVVVATDDERIRSVVEAFGGRSVMTGADHRSGTDRCYEAYVRCGMECDVVVNVQCDEPFVTAAQIEALKQCFVSDPATLIATLVKPFSPDDDVQLLFDTNVPKVVVDGSMHALYFSRSVVPHLRGVEPGEWLRRHTFYKHIGLYAYRPQTLGEIVALPESGLEKAESLEQLRWLQNGYAIKVGLSHEETIGIDTPEDLRRAEELLKNLK